MNGVKNFFEDWKEMCSASNSKSRMFYLCMTVGAIFSIVASFVVFVLAILGVITGTIAVMGFIGFPVVLVLNIIVAVWLARQ